MPRLPKSTDARLLAAIPRMQPWKADAAERLWSLREAGRQMLVFAGASSEIDLGGETGAFRIMTVDAKTGELKPRHESVRGGGLMKLPFGNRGVNIIWLTRE